MVGTITQAGAVIRNTAKPVGPQLAGRQVTQGMYNDAQTAKKSGLRVTMTTPGMMEDESFSDKDVCRNCGGLGKLYLQTIIAGPFKNHPGMNGDGPERVGQLRTGEWYKMTLNHYPCPVCSNTREIIL